MSGFSGPIAFVAPKTQSPLSRPETDRSAATILKDNAFVKWLLHAPDFVPDEMLRYYIYWRVFYFMGGLGHLMAMGLFYQAGVTFMVYFNMFSVAAFSIAFVLLGRGHYRIPFWLANLELILHGMAATICVGPLYSFQNYAFLVVVLWFIQPFYRLWQSSIFALGTVLSSGALIYYAVNTAPVYTIPESLANSMIVTAMISWPIYVLILVLPFIMASARAEKELAVAYDESERLLLNILPAPIAERLKATRGMIADDFDRVAILFADIVGFTAMSERLPPARIVALLNEVFNAIDELAARYKVEKIKTIGDAYMVVAGVPDKMDDPDDTIARLALDIQEAVSGFTLPDSDEKVQVRIGINSGKVVAGVIGQRKFAYDLWGDAVNVAARMEATGVPGRIQLAESLAAGLSDRFEFEPRGEVEVKGKGKIKTCFLVGEKAS